MTADVLPSTGAPPADVSDVRAALAQRLAVVAAEMGIAVPDPTRPVAELLSDVAAALQGDPSRTHVWLALLAVSGRYTDPAEVDQALRALPPATVTEICVWLLSWAAGASASAATARNLLRVVAGSVEDVGAAPAASSAAATAVRWSADLSGLRPAPQPDADVMLLPVGAAVVLTDVQAYDPATRRRAAALLADAPCAVIGYDRAIRAVRPPVPEPPRPTGVRMDDEGLAVARRDADAWRERAVEGWLLEVVPAPTPLSTRVWRRARREVSHRVVTPARVARARRRQPPQ